MSTREIEKLVDAWRSGDRDIEIGVRLSIVEALARRNEGNIPDDDDRSLRLVLFAGAEPLERKRLAWEPDYHDEPTWRREGSRPVNVVPLRTEGRPPATEAWWESPRIDELEDEWRKTGAVAGVVVPAEYRSFVFKTVIALQDAGRSVTARAVGDSISRWLSPEDASRVRATLKERGPD